MKNTNKLKGFCKRKRGWFKRAKYKWVRKNVLQWTLESWGVYSYYRLVYTPNSSKRTYLIESDLRNHCLMQIEDLGFEKGFWFARNLAKHSPDEWWFDYVRKLKEGGVIL